MSNTEYAIELTQEDVPCQVKIGGKTDKFVPNINASKWNNECWLNINHPDVIGVETETLTDGKIELIVGDNTHRYYVDKDGHLEYEIVLAKKPTSNIIELNLDFSDALQFLYQPALTQTEIDDGADRPDNVVGSYAVYWNRSNNQYRTGKFCHIYRPKVIDINGKELWCDQLIEGKKWTIEINQNWLDNAIYPIIIDPDLGYSTKGGSTSDTTNSDRRANHDTSDGTGGTTVELHMYCKNDNAADKFLLCLYDDDAGNDRPEDQLETEVEIEVANGFDGLKDVAYVAAIAANTKYWIGWALDQGNRITFYFDADADATRFAFITRGAYDLPANWGDAANNNTTRVSMWADYAPDVGVNRVPIIDHHNRMMAMMGS